MPSFNVTKFTGEDNVNGDKKGKFDVVENLDITRTGSLVTREGYERLLSLPAHSMFSNARTVLFRSGSDLLRLEPDETATVVASGFNPLVMQYIGVDTKIYFTDNDRTGVYDELTGRVRSWGLPVPTPPVAVLANGSMAKGMYAMCFTYQRDDGQESGASPITTIDVQTGGINVKGLADPGDPSITGLNLYMTGIGGKVFNRVLTAKLGAGQRFGVRNHRFEGPELATRNMSAPPAGTALEFYKGRIYIVAGTTVWHTELGSYELINRGYNHLQTEGQVTLFKANDRGIFLSTEQPDETAFLEGQDAVVGGGFQVKNRKPIVALRGAAVVLDKAILPDANSAPGSPIVFAATSGFYAGLPDGEIVELTNGVYKVPDAITASAIFVPDADSPKAVVSYVPRPSKAKLRVRLPIVQSNITGEII